MSEPKSADAQPARESPANVSGNPAKPAARFALLDGIRGIAAMCIAVYHIWRYEPEPYPAIEFVPGWIDWLLLRTWIGVQLLLVISGFVIAYTLRNTWVSPREALSFVGRRLVRLMPAYWLTLLVVVLLNAACVGWWSFPAVFSKSLTLGRVAAHLVFLQDITGQTPLSAGIWTICIEVQFYIVCVLGWGLAQRLSPRASPENPRPAAWAILVVFAPFALASLVYWNWLDTTEPWVTHFISFFFLGLVTWWALDKTVPAWAFIVTVATVVVSLALRWKVENAIALSMTLAIFTAGKLGKLQVWLNWRWLQYLGRISYSLYLIHYPVSHCLTWAGWRWFDNSPTPAQATLILSACLVASLIAGHLLYIAVEAPSVRLTAWMKSRSERASR